MMALGSISVYRVVTTATAISCVFVVLCLIEYNASALPVLLHPVDVASPELLAESSISIADHVHRISKRDSESDTDSDSDGDSDTNTDTDIDSDVNTDADTDTDTDSGSGSGSGSDSDSDSDINGDIDSNSESGTNTDNNTETDTSSSSTDSDSDSDEYSLNELYLLVPIVLLAPIFCRGFCCCVLPRSSNRRRQVKKRREMNDERRQNCNLSTVPATTEQSSTRMTTSTTVPTPSSNTLSAPQPAHFPSVHHPTTSMQRTGVTLSTLASDRDLQQGEGRTLNSDSNARSARSSTSSSSVRVPPLYCEVEDGPPEYELLYMVDEDL